MANLVVMLIILASAAYQYLKGTFVKSFAMVMTAICASVVAFGYFELLANVFINRGTFVPWAQTLSFALLFILAFAILQTIASQLTRRSVSLGLLAERIGRIVCGIFLGLILSGFLLTALAMAPISNKFPYQRFDASNPDAERPNKVLLNADGFVTGWFNIISSGSFSGKRSFAILHPDFLDQVFLNRHNITDEIPIITGTKAIKIPKKKAAWPAPENLKDSNGKPISSKDAHNLTIVRVGMTSEAIKDGGFTPSQLRLICKQNSGAKNPLAGKGKNVYPVGYLNIAHQLKMKQLNDQIKIERSDLIGKERWIDFAFYVPDDFVPVLVEFKQNSVARVPPLVTLEQAPPAAPFIQSAECASVTTELKPTTSAKIYGLELAAGSKLLADLKLEVSDANQWNKVQTDRSIKPVQFEDGKINYVRAELKIEKPVEEEAKDSEPAPKKSQKKDTFKPSREYVKKDKGLADMLKPLDGYKLLSLKCNNPVAGAAIKGEQLPVLVELSGLIQRPVGVIISGQVGDQIIYEVDYCAITAKDTTGGLSLAEDGSVAQPFPDTIWLTEQAQSISEFFVLYLVKSGRNAIIISVQSADSQAAAGFKKHEGFSVK